MGIEYRKILRHKYFKNPGHIKFLAPIFFKPKHDWSRKITNICLYEKKNNQPTYQIIVIDSKNIWQNNCLSKTLELSFYFTSVGHKPLNKKKNEWKFLIKNYFKDINELYIFFPLIKQS